MRTLPTLAALAIASVCVPFAIAQTTSPGTAGSTTGTTTTQTEMNRGVPAVDADVGRNAAGAIDVDRDKNTNVRNAPGARGTDMAPAGSDMDTRAPRADRN